MVVLVPDSGESAYTVPTLVRLFTRVDAHVHEQVTSLVEVFLAPHALEKAVT